MVRVVAVETSKPKRWRAFVCPDCRQVLRVARDHAGAGIVCVACDRLLRLPDPGESPSLLRDPVGGERPSGESRSFAKAEGRAVGDEEVGRLKKRRRVADDEEEIFDETFADKAEASPWMIQAGVASVALLGAIVVATLLWPKGEQEESTDLPSGLPAAAAEASDATGEETGPTEELLPIKLVADVLEPRIRAFLEAPSLEEQAELVYRPERVLPWMREYHGDAYEPAGFRSVVWSAANRWQGDWAIVVVTDESYERRMIALNRADDWKISWEAMTGWSEVDWETIKRDRPRETLLCRAMVKRSDYYNFGFADESEWLCFFLSSPDGERGLYGYVRRGSEAHAKLDFLEGQQTVPFVLRIRYPDEAPADNQVLIEEVVARDWADDSSP